MTLHASAQQLLGDGPGSEDYHRALRLSFISHLDTSDDASGGTTRPGTCRRPS